MSKKPAEATIYKHGSIVFGIVQPEEPLDILEQAALHRRIKAVNERGTFGKIDLRTLDFPKDITIQAFALLPESRGISTSAFERFLDGLFPEHAVTVVLVKNINDLRLIYGLIARDILRSMA